MPELKQTRTTPWEPLKEGEAVGLVLALGRRKPPDLQVAKHEEINERLGPNTEAKRPDKTTALPDGWIDPGNELGMK